LRIVGRVAVGALALVALACEIGRLVTVVATCPGVAGIIVLVVRAEAGIGAGHASLGSVCGNHELVLVVTADTSIHAALSDERDGSSDVLGCVVGLCGCDSLGLGAAGGDRSVLSGGGGLVDDVGSGGGLVDDVGSGGGASGGGLVDDVGSGGGLVDDVGSGGGASGGGTLVHGGGGVVAGTGDIGLRSVSVNDVATCTVLTRGGTVEFHGIAGVAGVAGHAGVARVGQARVLFALSVDARTIVELPCAVVERVASALVGAARHVGMVGEVLARVLGVAR